MPWRGHPDPYAIWVSEVMLQQTQVATVGQRFDAFLERFPTAEALAKASLDDVLKAWEGMGYYGRARNMHRAAKQVVAEHGGRLPTTAKELATLPGIGRYTAGAIASMAFGADEAALDGNVIRVLCRVFRIVDNPRETQTLTHLWSLAQELLPSGKAGVFNQAMMDLGATVCTPRRPACETCPLRRVCQAFARKVQEDLPSRPARRKIPHYDVAVGVVRRRRRILITRRRDEGLLGGLWEFPGGKRHRGETLKACAAREILEEVNLSVDVVGPLVTVKHAYTHFRVTLHAYLCEVVSGRPRAVECAAWRWITLDEVDRFAFPAGTHKIIAALRRRRDD